VQERPGRDDEGEGDREERDEEVAPGELEEAVEAAACP
jgi:hypothetical protein